MPEQVRFELSNALAERTVIHNFVRALQREYDDAEVVFVRYDDHACVECGLSTAVRLAQVLRNRVFESSSEDREETMALGALLKKVEHAIDRVLNGDPLACPPTHGDA